ncbi:MAG: aminodeoxychorismate lyase [Spongiibacteraceae bacterium]
MSTLAWLDGKSIASLTAEAVNADLMRGVAYGDGLFETISVNSGRAQFFALHLERLRAGCRRLHIECDEVALCHEIEIAVNAGVEGVLKIIVVRAGVERGYASRRNAGSHRLLQFFRQNGGAFFNRQPPAILRVCRQHLSVQPTLAGIKHLNRLEQVLARAEWSDPQITEGLMLDANGRVIEAVSSNIFCVRAGEVLTPSLHQCGVAGVLRRVVIDYLGIAVIEQMLTLDDFYRADEVFLTSTQRGIQPVVQLDCVHWQYGGVTIALQQKLERLLAQPTLFP